MIKTIVDRLKEPSTYAGLAGMAAALGLGAEDWQTISMALAGVDTTKADIRKGLKKALDPLIEKTIMWKKARDAAAQVIEEWQEPGS